MLLHRWLLFTRQFCPLGHGAWQWNSGTLLRFRMQAGVFMLVVSRVSKKKNGPSPIQSVDTGTLGTLGWLPSPRFSQDRTCNGVRQSEASVVTSWVRRCILNAAGWNREPAALTVCHCSAPRPSPRTRCWKCEQCFRITLLCVIVL